MSTWMIFRWRCENPEWLDDLREAIDIFVPHLSDVTSWEYRD